ncbi:beta-hexosaminidase [Vibrio sp. JCM 19236]|nr:beta-hexosaminidase [Vibrio sp. JCM 19236]
MTHLSLSQEVVQLNEHTAQFTITLHNNSSKTLSNWELIFSITRFLKSDSISIGTLSQLGSLCSVTELPELAIDESLSFTLEMETPPLRLQCDTILEAYVDINGERLDIEIAPANIDSAYNEPTAVPEVEASAIGLIPKPNELTLLEGELKLGNICHYSIQSDAAESSIAWLKQAVSHIQFEPSEDGTQLVFAGLDKLEIGAYQLEVTHDQITLNACDSEGFRNATASLVQLLGSSNTLGCLRISDAPQYGYRGMMLDCCRHFHSIETVKAVIDQLARYKYNHFHWHLTDDEGWRVEIKAYPERPISARGAGLKRRFVLSSSK